MDKYYANETQTSIEDHRQACQNMGGSLAMIKTAEDLERLDGKSIFIKIRQVNILHMKTIVHIFWFKPN